MRNCFVISKSVTQAEAELVNIYIYHSIGKTITYYRVLAHLSKSNSRTFQGPYEGYISVGARIEAPRRVGFLETGVPLPSRLGCLGERRELPQRDPGQSPSRQRILGIFQGLRILLLEAMHCVLENLIQALSRTVRHRFKHFQGPCLFSRTFQALKIWKKFKDFQGPARALLLTDTRKPCYRREDRVIQQQK